MPINPNLGGSGDASGPGGSGSGGSGGGGGGGGGSKLVTPGSVGTGGITTGTFGIFRQAADRVERGPAIDIDPKAIVTVTPETSAGAQNTVVVGVAVGPGEMARGGPRIALLPAANPRTVRVRNLNEIGVYSTVVGEGVVIDVQYGG